jgi:hypothetical protein
LSVLTCSLGSRNRDTVAKYRTRIVIKKIILSHGEYLVGRMTVR